MKFERTKNSARTFTFGIINRITTILCPFITRTLIIYKLGSEYMGLSGLFTSVLSVLNISELGIGSAVAFCLYEPVANDKKDIICALLGFIRKFYRTIGLLMLAVGIAVMPFLKYLIKGTCPADLNLYVLYIIYLLNSAVSYLFFAYKEVIFGAYQRRDMTHKFLIISEIVKYVLQIFILLTFANYYLFVIALLISTLSNTLLIGIYSKKMYPDLLPKGKLEKKYKDIMKSKVGYLAACSISSILVNSADNIVISAGIGLTAVTVYGNYNYISSSVLAFILIFCQSLGPAMGNALVSESKEKNAKLFNTLWFIISWIIIWCSVCLVCLYKPFITVWLGENFLLSAVTMLLIVLLFFFNSFSQFFSSVYVGTAGLWNKTTAFRIAASVVNLALNFLLVKKFGIAGIVIASVSAYALISLPAHIAVTYKYILKTPVSKGFLRLLKNILLLALFGGITYFLCEIISVDGILGLILKGFICLIVPNGLYYLFVRKSEEFISAKSYIIALLKKGK